MRYTKQNMIQTFTKLIKTVLLGYYWTLWRHDSTMCIHYVIIALLFIVKEKTNLHCICVLVFKVFASPSLTLADPHVTSKQC